MTDLTPAEEAFVRAHFENPDTPTPGFTATVGNVSYEYTRGGEVKAAHAAQHTVTAGGDGDDIMSTFRRKAGGSPIDASRADERNSLVRFKGYDMSPEMAMSMGAPIERDPGGGYRRKGGEGAALAAAAPQSPSGGDNEDPTGPPDFDASTELADDYGLAPEEVASFESISSSVDYRKIESLAETIIMEGRADALDRSVTGQAITNAGLGREARAVLEGMQREGDRAVSALGIEPQAFYSWAWKHEASSLRAAMRQHFQTGDARAYATLVHRFRTR